MNKEKPNIWPKISIVTPSFNQCKYLERTIESVLSQNYPNLEYLIIDGGSTDSSIEIIKQYADKISFWVSEKDNGQADSIKKGLDRATGDIFAFLNSDDVLTEKSLFIVAEEFNNNKDLGVLAGAGGMIDSNDNFLYGTYPLGWNRYILLSSQSRYMQPSVFYSKKSYKQAGGINPDMKCCLDFEFFVRLADTKIKHKIIYKKLSYTRLHPLTKTATWQEISDKEKYEIYKKYNFNDNNIKYKLFFMYNRVKHFLFRIYYEGILNTLKKRSRKILYEHNTGNNNIHKRDNF
ncbi:MAG TPA: hypothetical protein DCP53_00440 [Elusimicrobia bacterium]|nr:hypothetical protein [Elusimicrobiota bacterium]